MLAALPTGYGLAAEVRETTVIAVFDFNYIDTSGEVRDQHTEHAARLDRFMSAIRRDLAAQGKFRVVTPACNSEPCLQAQSTPSGVLNAATEAGAGLLVIGTIQKMSTLVQWAKVEVMETKSGRVLLDKLFTFRGDSDEAWTRAEAFIASELTTQKWSDR
jgi:Protein of unknown function (DUF2380)